MSLKLSQQISLITLSAAFVFATATSYAQEEDDVVGTASVLANPEQMQKVNRFNRMQKQLKEDFRSDDVLDTGVLRPFADYETVGHIFFSAENQGESPAVKEAIMKNLPAGIQAIYVRSAAWVYKTTTDMNVFKKYFDLSRLAVLDAGNNGNTSFWARDSIPVPVYMKDGGAGAVDAKYYHNFEPDAQVGKFLNIPIVKLDYYNEGGNFIADSKGRCLMVENERTREISDAEFQRVYGRASVHRFPHLRGIGHVDERIRLHSDTVVLTDTPEYKAQLEEMGYQVHMLPVPAKAYETYANAVALNGTIILPIFNQPTDKVAIKLHQDLGYKVVPVKVDKLPNQALGSIHCMTMTYPVTKK